ncbi:MAG TPA: hypothetical protein VGK33_09175 [Chloroflexota bacterium]
MIRRRLAVTLAVLAALVGEWLGHSLNYYRLAGVGGLQSALTSGIHDYMLPLGLALLVAAAAGAAGWTRAWLALSRRLDDSATALGLLRRGRRPADLGQGGAARQGSTARTVLGRRGPAPSFAARVVALAVPMGALQCSLYLVQENLERALHGVAWSGLAPLLDGYGAAVWIQAAVAVLMAAALILASRLLHSKRVLVERCERLVGVLWQRAVRGTSSPLPRRSDVLPTSLIFRSVLWGRPPPVLTAT